MSGPRKMSFSNPTPDQLHALVLDYLFHSCYNRTAEAFSKDHPTRQLDADGDEILSDATGDPSDSIETMLNQVQLRQEIRTTILSGRAEEAITLLNKHFPSVLADNSPTTKFTPSEPTSTSKPDSDYHIAMNNLEYISSTTTEPAHLLLNLRILAFSEACRSVPLIYSPEIGLSRKEANPVEESMDRDVKIEADAGDVEGQQMALLRKAQKLYALTNMLPDPADRKTYLKELENVSALLVYPVPEESPMAKYLTMERREAVADQINRAILKGTGQPLISALELITRYTTILWSYAKSNGAKPRPGAVLPSKSAGSSAMDIDDEEIPAFDLQQFLDSKP